MNRPGATRAPAKGDLNTSLTVRRLKEWLRDQERSQDAGRCAGAR
jgi:hypothetical protein